MKKIIFLSVIFVFLFSAKSFAQYEGTVGLGAHAGYATSIKSVGAGVNLHYYHTNRTRLAPSFTYYLPRKGQSAWQIDADAHYVLPVSWLFSVYPIAGVNYSHFKFDASKSSATGEQNWTKHRIGANLGLGLQYDFGYKTRVSVEYKYQFIKDFTQSAVMVGVGFWI